MGLFANALPIFNLGSFGRGKTGKGRETQEKEGGGWKEGGGGSPITPSPDEKRRHKHFFFTQILCEVVALGIRFEPVHPPEARAAA